MLSKPDNYYCVRSPKGHIWLSTARKTPKSAKTELWDGLVFGEPPWEESYRLGYRIVEVEVQVLRTLGENDESEAHEEEQE